MFQDYLVANRFYPRAKSLRKIYDENFSPADVAHQSRFVWDYWYHQNKYVHFRTPALSYFPEALINQFTDHLVNWGQKTLGCNAITAPWLSYYIDGCKQELHGDIPHGPWAYVYSLTLDPSRFTGGETLMLKAPILDYWNHWQSFDGLAHQDIFESIPSDFNRLLVFDGRIPHGVSMVQGPRDPKLARVVLHGWFTEPSPHIEGPLSARNCAKVLNQKLSAASADFDAMQSTLAGTLALRLQVNAQGELEKISPLISSLKAAGADTKALTQEIVRVIKKHFRDAKFEKAKAASQITLPLIFSPAR